MYITPAPCGSVAQGDRHQAAADLHEVVYLLEVLRVLLDQLLRQIGEVFLAKSAKEECSLDDSVALDRAIPFLLRMVEGFLLADQCDRIIEGVDRLNVAADRRLQAFKVAADFLCVGLLAGFNDKNVHGNAPLLLFRFSCGSDILTLNRRNSKQNRQNKCDKHRSRKASELYIAQEPPRLHCVGRVTERGSFARIPVPPDTGQRSGCVCLIPAGTSRG